MDNAIRRLAYKFAYSLLGALGVLAAGAVISAIVFVINMPHRLKVVEDAQAQTSQDVADMKDGFWAIVAIDCLKLPDSIFVQTKLPCGKAYRVSGVDKTLSAPAFPPSLRGSRRRP